MKIAIDKNIPFLKGVVENYGDVKYLSGSEFTKENIRDVDTLIVRTVTHFGRELLEDSKVKLICSATIGYDHIDTKYCDEKGIIWRNAPGCNSGSVQQYVLSALVSIAHQKGFDLRNKTIGIVGVGNVGTKVAKACKVLGMKVLLNDPPRHRMELSDEFVDIDTIKDQSDIITFHTPLIKQGLDITYHMADESFFNSLSKQPIIINSARGGIICTDSIKQAISDGKISGAIIDCWENEPSIDTEYMKIVDIATPHIAGYSSDGKANASKMSLESIADFWKLSKDIISTIKAPDIINSSINISDFSGDDKTREVLLATYNIMDDCHNLRTDPSCFSQLRGNYPIRREYNAYTIEKGIGKELDLFAQLGFNISK